MGGAKNQRNKEEGKSLKKITVLLTFQLVKGEFILTEDRIISALIGLVRACNTNPKTDDTDGLVIKTLTFTLLYPEHDDKAVSNIIDEIYSEKNAVAPGCAVCTAPCGNTSDYDMRRIYEADDSVRKVKLQILEKLQELATYVCRNQSSETIDSEFFYKALSYVSYDMDGAELLELLNEAKNIEYKIKSGGIQNDKENNKN